jgi:hypothetical protein
MEPEGSLPYSQLLATCPYPELTPSSPHDPLNIHAHCTTKYSNSLSVKWSSSLYQKLPCQINVTYLATCVPIIVRPAGTAVEYGLENKRQS